MKEVKVLTIQDYSSFGQCSLSVAMPIISAMGIETIALPVSLLSTHTSGFEGYTCVDLCDNILPAAMHHKSLGIDFDYIYTGYLGSLSAIKSVEKICSLYPDAKLIVDPAMAENGKLYNGITCDFVESISSLCQKSLIALPNLSEACMLSDEPYYDVVNINQIKKICEKLTQNGITRFIITGIRTADGMLIAYCDNNNLEFVNTQEIKGNFHGSGDVFASAFVGALANGLKIPKSLRVAVEYTQKTISLTAKDKSHWYGLKFEKTIPYLIKLLQETQK